MKRRVGLILFEMILLVLCGILMYNLQTRLFLRNANREIDLTFQDTERILTQTREDSEDNYDSYEMILKAKTQMARYYIRNDADTGYSTISMSKLKELLNVDNVYLTDKDGNIVTYATPGMTTSFTDEEDPFFSDMKKIEGTDKVSEVGYYMFLDNEDDADNANAPDNPDTDKGIVRAFCAGSLESVYYIVIEDDAEGLFELQGESASWDSVLPRITLAKNGFVFSVDKEGYVSAFSDADEEQVVYVEELGVSMDKFRDGFRGTLILQGNSYYCGMKYYDEDESYLVCAIPSEEITSNLFVVTVIPYFVTFILLSLQLLYAVMLSEEWRGRDKKGKPVTIRRFLLKRMAVLLILSVICTIAISLYTQVLYAMILQAESNKRETEALAVSLARNEELRKMASEGYYRDLETLTTLAGRFISNNPKQVNREDLAEIAKTLGAEHILLYDKSGTVILSDAYYKGLRISYNPHDLSYEFKEVLTGTPVLAQEKVDENYLDKPYRYVGAIVTDQNDELNGFVQLAFSPDFLHSSLSTSSIESLPSTFSGRNNAFAFIVDNEKKTFLYYPQEDMINDSVEDYGLTDEMMQEAYISRARFDGEERLLYCGVWEDDYLFTAASVSEITLESVSRGIYISLAGVMTQLICFLIILLSAGKHSEASPGLEEEWKEEAEKDMVERLAANRISGLLRLSLFVFSAVVSTLILLKEVLFKNYEILLNLLNGNWNTGIHVFSVTACWIDCCLIFFAMSIVLILLELVGQLMNSRGETVVRMLISFTRYIAVIGTVFHCARLLGAPTDTLLASAGILTIVVGLGAQSLVTDVLAGLFVIFEKAFKVGDIIMMDNWRGRVLEIGIRNTRVMDILDNNIKIIHNSSLNQIVNLSDLPTYLYTTIGTEYGADLVRIEDILARELPEIHERIPQAIEGPFYRGVSELGDSCVELKFLTVCRNEDYYVVKYAVNREIKLVFDRYSIQVPFPQIVINYRDREKGSEEEE